VARHDVQKRLACAQHRQLVASHRGRTVGPDVIAPAERDWCSPEESAPGRLVFGRTLAKRQSDCGVLGDLLRQVAVDWGQSARPCVASTHAMPDSRLRARSGITWSAFPTERRKLIDDDQRRTWTERRNTHEVEQN